MSKAQVTLNRKQAAEFLNCTPAAISKLVEDGRLQGTTTASPKSGRLSYKITMADLTTYQRENNVKVAKPTNHNAELFGIGTITRETAPAKPVGLMTDILNEIRAINRRLDDLEKLWS